MNRPPDEQGEGDRNPLERLIEEFLQRLSGGEAITVEGFAADHPEHADQILELLPTVVAMETYKRDREVSNQGLASLGPRRLERLGDYRILGELGRGGMGVVFEAVQESLGRKVAVKVLPNQHLLGERQLRRFEREARIAAALHHTNIVPIFGTGGQDGYHYYVMQLIRGIGLDRLVRALAETAAPAGDDPPALPLAGGDAPLEARDVARALRSGLIRSLGGRDEGERAIWVATARIGIQVASALAYAHDQGTLHRDIKPANLLLDAQGRVWVTDFGLSKAAGGDTMTLSGCFAGTLAYMAPEQFDGRYDVRTDIHGLGLVLYELLTLRPAYREEERSRLIQAITTREPVDPRRVNPAVPVDLETIVMKALARDPRHRYQKADDLGRDLGRFLAGKPISARRVSLMERAWLWCARNPAMARLASLALLAVLGAMVTGWVAYGITSDALQGEREKREEARRATGRAEANLGLVLESYEDIFRHLAGGPAPITTVPTTEGSTLEPMIRPAVDPANARLLQGMLRFYDRFAQENQGNRELREHRIRAWRRMGDIQQRLGKYAEALEFYDRAITGIMDLAVSKADKLLRTAAIRNEIGRVKLLSGYHLDCLSSHNRAMKELEALPLAELPPDRQRQARYELARTMNFLGAFRFDVNTALGGVVIGLTRVERSGGLWGLMGSSPQRGNVRYHRRAISICRELLAASPGDHEFRFMLARSRHLLAASLFMASRDQDALEQLTGAIKGLEELCRDHEEVGFYRFELAQAYLLGASAPLKPPGLTGMACLKKGVSLHADLHRQNGDNPLYRVALAKSRFKLAENLAHRGRPEEAMAQAEPALRLFDGLVAGAPTMLGYRILAMRCRRLMAPLLARQGQRQEGLAMLDRAIATVQELMASQSGNVTLLSKFNYYMTDYVVLRQLRERLLGGE